MFLHETVLKEKAVEALHIREDGIYIDCTLGGAGHSLLIANQLDTTGTLIGLDRDQQAIEAAKEKLQATKCKVYLRKKNFQHIKEVTDELGIKLVDGILFDLGVSSPQLDQKERGFSYHHEAPLDMRMDQDQKFSAFELVNEWAEEKIVEILFRYGEERFSRRIAHHIVRERQKKPIQTTTELVEIIKQAIPARARRTGPHPARRTFQAIRIAVNNELHELERALEHSLQLLKTNGRICVITFHSLEDRICKKFFKTHAQGCICPPHFPVCSCDHHPLLKIITKKPIYPSIKEIQKNKRARSAKLRVAEKI